MFSKISARFSFTVHPFYIKTFVLLLISFIIQLNYLSEQSHDKLETKR